MEQLISGIILIVIAAAAWYVYQRQQSGGGMPKITPISGKKGSFSAPTLMQHARDLTAAAENDELDPVIGREEEIERVIQVLSRRTKNNPVLVGKAGVGKTAIVEGLAQAIAESKVPKTLKGQRVLSLDLSGILAGTKYRGEFEQRLKKISDEMVAAKRQIILFVDEVHSLAEAGEASGGIDASDILKPALARGDLQMVGATTFIEYRKFIKPDATLDRRFEPILVDEPTPTETKEILHGIKDEYEEHHGVTITNAAIDAAVAEAKKIKDKSFPDKAIDLMDEAAAHVNLEVVEGKRTSKQVGKKDVLVVAREREEDAEAGL